MSDFDTVAIMCGMIDPCGRCRVEEAAAPAVAVELAGDGNGPMRVPAPGQQSAHHRTNAIRGEISTARGGEEGEDSMMERKLDVIAALPEECRERVEAVSKV